MKRDAMLYIDDIMESIKDLEEFTRNLNEEIFSRDRLRQSAVLRQLEIIGEAAKNIPNNIKAKYFNIPWKDIAGFRDKLSHAYFGVDIKRVWNVIKKDIPILKKEIQKIK